MTSSGFNTILPLMLLYLRFSDEIVIESEEVSPGLVVDFDAEAPAGGAGGFAGGPATAEGCADRRRMSPRSRPLIAGIVNVTPDNIWTVVAVFSTRRRRRSPTLAKLIAEGADILDIGGESTRPGAAPTAEADEIGRIVPLIEAIRREGAMPISVDIHEASRRPRGRRRRRDHVERCRCAHRAGRARKAPPSSPAARWC